MSAVKKQRKFNVEVRTTPSRLGAALGAQPGEWERINAFDRLQPALTVGAFHDFPPKLFVRGTEYRIKRTDTKL